MEQMLNVMKHSQDMFIERGFTVKESKECGAGGSMVTYWFSFLWKGVVGGIGLQHGDILILFLLWEWRGVDTQCLWWNIDCVSQALLTMASPEEALRALAVMHNYAPEEYKVGLGEGNITISLSVLKLSFMPSTIMLSIMKFSLFSSRMLLVFASHSVQPESNLTPRCCNQDLQKVTSLIKPCFWKTMNWVALTFGVFPVVFSVVQISIPSPSSHILV